MIAEWDRKKKELDDKFGASFIRHLKREESFRRIERTFQPAKVDVSRVEAGMKPNKPFVSRKDFLFWKQIVKKTDQCIRLGNDPSVSNAKE